MHPDSNPKLRSHQWWAHTCMWSQRTDSCQQQTDDTDVQSLWTKLRQLSRVTAGDSTLWRCRRAVSHGRS